MKFKELQQKVFKNKTDKQIDYRFKMLSQINHKLKSCKLFVIQRIVRKIKDIKTQKSNKYQDQDQEKEKKLDQLDQQLKQSKAISNEQIKHLSFYIFKVVMGLDIQSNQDKENKIQQQFEKKFQEANIEWDSIDDSFLERNSSLDSFYRSIQGLKKYEEINKYQKDLLFSVQKKISKSKERKMKKQKKDQEKKGVEFKKGVEQDEDELKKQLQNIMQDEGHEVMEIGQIDHKVIGKDNGRSGRNSGSGSKTISNHKNNRKERRQKERYKQDIDKQQNNQYSNHQGKQQNNNRQQSNDRYQNSSRQQKWQQNGYRSNQKEIRFDSSSQKEQKIQDLEKLHPSMQAAIMRKQELQQTKFQGTKKQL